MNPVAPAQPEMVQRRPRATIPTLAEDAMKLSDGSRDFLQYIATVRGASPATVENYGRTHSQFLAFLRGRGLDDHARHFTPDYAMAFCEYLGARGIAGNTIINKLHALRALALYLLKRKDRRGMAPIKVDPTRGFAWPREVQPKTDFLYPHELRALMDVPLDPDTALLRDVLADTGIRALEAVEANVGDVREVDGTVYLTLRVKGRRSANAEPASIPLSAGVADAVKDALLRRGMPPADAPLFLTRKGERYLRTQLTQTFIRLGARCGITRVSTSPHKLRHTANVIARLAGIDPLTRAAMLNHRSLRTLARYDHLVPGETAKGRLAARQGLDQYLAQGGCDTALRATPAEVPAKPAKTQEADTRNPCVLAQVCQPFRW